MELKSQNWIKYDKEEFPFLTSRDLDDSFHPSLDQYKQKLFKDYERAKKEFGFNSYFFDVEFSGELEDYAALIDSILSLLPDKCEYEIVEAYTDEKANKWVVDVNVNGDQYQFSTIAVSGAFLEMVDIYENFDEIIARNIPDYKMISPMDYGQIAEVFIEKKEDLKKASQIGFPYPPFYLEFNRKIPKNWYLLLPEAIIENEEKLIETYIEVSNEFHRDFTPEKKLNKENFHICDITGNGPIYIWLHGKIIESPSRFNNMVRCYPNLPSFIFAYSVVKMNDCDLYLYDTKEMKRRLLNLEELKDLIETNLLNE